MFSSSAQLRFATPKDTGDKKESSSHSVTGWSSSQKSALLRKGRLEQRAEKIAAMPEKERAKYLARLKEQAMHKKSLQIEYNVLLGLVNSLLEKAS